MAIEFTRSPARGRVWREGIALVALWAVVGGAWGADNKIQYSDRTAKLPLATPGPEKKEGSGLDAKDPQSVLAPAIDTVSIPPSQPNGSASQRLLQLYDQRKNWMFQDPNAGASGSSLKQMLSIDPNPFGTENKDSKLSIERHFDGRDRTGRGATNAAAGSSRDETDASRESASAFAPGAGASGLGGGLATPPAAGLGAQSPGLGWAPGNVPTALSPALSGLAPGGRSGLVGAPLSGSLFDSAADRRAAQTRSESFRQLLDGPSSGRNPLAGPLDPINFAPDSGMSALNPIVPKAAASGPGLPGAGPVLAAPPGGMAGAGRFDAFGGRGGLGSSLTPALATPAPTLQVTPKPAVLEFPRRSF